MGTWCLSQWRTCSNQPITNCSKSTLFLCLFARSESSPTFAHPDHFHLESMGEIYNDRSISPALLRWERDLLTTTVQLWLFHINTIKVTHDLGCLTLVTGWNPYFGSKDRWPIFWTTGKNTNLKLVTIFKMTWESKNEVRQALGDLLFTRMW